MLRALTPEGKVIAKKMIDLRLTQTELAARVGISQEYLSMIMYGERLGRRYIGEICKVLGIKTR